MLGLAADANESDIRSAYRAQALSHHHDRGGDPDVMAMISAAYERLLGAGPATPERSPSRPAPTIDPDDYTIGHSMLAFVVVPVIVAVILFIGVFSVLSTIL